VAQRLSAAVRECDTVARLGGDEFVVMAQDFSEDRSAAVTQAEAFAAKILAALNQPYTLKGVDSGGYRNTPSIGISLFRGHEQPFDLLLKQADIALYRAKDAGRGTFSLYNAEMETALNEKNLMQTRLRQALAQGDFRLYFQPKVDGTHHIIGAEALLRWHSPGKAVATPSSFIPLAEKTGLILPIGKWVLESACATLAAWAANPETDKLEISINISARQFHQPDFVAIVCAALASTGANPALLKLELNETIVLKDIEDTIGKMRELRELGVTFALDNFGTGYSSLSFLKRLPLNQVKIDRSLVHDMVSDSGNATIVRTIIDMSHSLGLQTLAEGVETAEQLAFLRENDCRLFQGYLFGRPMPATEFKELLAEHNPA
jgi:predicted signal transduction protein with EAL and GGDEF domain